MTQKVCTACKEPLRCPLEKFTECARCQTVAVLMKGWGSLPASPYWTVVLSLAVNLRHMEKKEEVEGFLQKIACAAEQASKLLLFQYGKAADVKVRQHE